MHDPWRRAEDWDYWLRHVIEGDSIRTKEPRVKVKYLENRLEEVAERPWTRELSGRILSKATNIEQSANQAAAAQGMKFRHVIYVNVAAVRQLPEMDVFEEQTGEDPAHANLVAYRVPMAPILDPAQPAKISQEFMLRLVLACRVCDATNLQPLEQLRR